MLENTPSDLGRVLVHAHECERPCGAKHRCRLGTVHHRVVHALAHLQLSLNVIFIHGCGSRGQHGQGNTRIAKCACGDPKFHSNHGSPSPSPRHLTQIIQVDQRLHWECWAVHMPMRNTEVHGEPEATSAQTTHDSTDGNARGARNTRAHTAAGVHTHAAPHTTQHGRNHAKRTLRRRSNTKDAATAVRQTGTHAHVSTTKATADDGGGCHCRAKIMRG